MMKNSFLWFIALFAISGTSAQTFQDAEGESSILMPFGSITLNTKAPNLSVSYYYGVPTLGAGIDFKNERKTNQFLSGSDSANIAGKRVLFGVKAQGESKTGLVSVFKEGKFVPSSTIGGIIGIRGFITCHGNVFQEYRVLNNNLKLIKSNYDLIKSNQQQDSIDFENLKFALT